MKTRVKVMLIAYLTVGGVATLTGILMLIISSVGGLHPTVGIFLLLAGLIQLSVGLWLYKRQGRGILD